MVIGKSKLPILKVFLKARTEVGRRHILVTDGGKSGSAEIVQAIEQLGHQAVLAHNYPDALLKALDHFPALFIICLSPGDPDSWKFAEKLQRQQVVAQLPDPGRGRRKDQRRRYRKRGQVLRARHSFPPAQCGRCRSRNRPHFAAHDLNVLLKNHSVMRKRQSGNALHFFVTPASRRHVYASPAELDARR